MVKFILCAKMTSITTFKVQEEGNCLCFDILPCVQVMCKSHVGKSCGKVMCQLSMCEIMVASISHMFCHEQVKGGI